MEKEYFSNTIVRIAGKNKFLEFKDGMTPAYTKHYAMLQGAIGKEYATNSGIQVEITDYTEKDNTKQKSVLVPCYVFEEIKDVCLKNNGSMTISSPEIVEMMNLGNRFYRSYNGILKEMMTSIGSIIKNKPKEPLAEVGKALKVAFFRMNGKNDNGEASDAKSLSVVSFPFDVDWEYAQTRVNSSYPNPDGTCACSTLSIKRLAYNRKSDGTVEKNGNPWFVTLSKFTAFPRELPNGTVVYDSHKPIRDKVDLNFRTTDEEMMRGVYAVEHFIGQWERANLASFIEGLEARKKMFASR